MKHAKGIAQIVVLIAVIQVFTILTSGFYTTSQVDLALFVLPVITIFVAFLVTKANKIGLYASAALAVFFLIGVLVFFLNSTRGGSFLVSLLFFALFTAICVFGLQDKKSFK
ncbi:MAG: hypothetical protein NT141_02500 [candidate division WWE3 bacterium]|nr:hypothetical protein [candidate division WWE3 bacterium]